MIFLHNHRCANFQEQGARKRPGILFLQNASGKKKSLLKGRVKTKKKKKKKGKGWEEMFTREVPLEKKEYGQIIKGLKAR